MSPAICQDSVRKMHPKSAKKYSSSFFLLATWLLVTGATFFRFLSLQRKQPPVERKSQLTATV